MLRHIPLIIRTSLYAFFALYVLFIFFPQIDPDIELFFQTYKREILMLFVADIFFGFGQQWECWKFRKRSVDAAFAKDDPKRCNFINVNAKQEKDK